MYMTKPRWQAPNKGVFIKYGRGRGAEDFQGGPPIFSQASKGGPLSFHEVGRGGGGHLFFRKKISKLTALSIKLIAILTDILSLQPHI